MKSLWLFLFSFLSAPWMQKFWHAVYMLWLAWMGYGYGINHLPHAKKIAYKRLGYSHADKDFIVFDVGANIGQTIQEIQDLHLPYVKIFSFEPQQFAFKALKEKFGNEKNISLFPFAFGKESGNMTFFRSSDADTSASIIPSRDHSECIEETVAIRTIDDFVAEHSIPYISYIKMDIEWAEFFALQWAKETLATGKIEAIEFEFLFKNLDARVNFRDFWHMLSPQYEIYRILPRSITRISSYSHLLEIYCLSNFLCIKKYA